MAFMQQYYIKWRPSAMGVHGGTVYNSYLFFGFSDCKSGPPMRTRLRKLSKHYSLVSGNLHLIM